MNKLFTLGSLLGFMLLGSSANAHWVETNPNHAHVCTQYSELSVRNKPYTDKYGTPSGKIIDSLPKGSTIQIKGTYSNWENENANSYWYHIYLDQGKTGYVSADYICF